MKRKYVKQLDKVTQENKKKTIFFKKSRVWINRRSS